MANFVSDTTYEERVLNLVESVLLSNSITADATDYVITSVEPVVNEADLVKGNTLMKLAPINTNLELENLVLFYNRQTLSEVLQLYTPKVYIASNGNRVSEVLDQILSSISYPQLITMNDVYDSFVVEDTSSAFVELHCLPESFFYTGIYRVPVEFVSKELKLTFDNVLVNKP